MRNLMSRHGGNRGRASVLAVTVTAFVLTVAACGASDSGGSGSGPGAGATASSAADQVDDATVQATIDKAMLTDTVKLADLDPTVQDAFRHASVELTDDQLAKAYECWTGTSCDIGDGDVTLGIAEAYGQNQWRKISKMEVILQALTYPEIGKIIYTDAQGDLAKFQSNVRSLAAQGAKAIVSYNDFGSAALPAFQAAQAQGAKISTYVGPVPDAPATS